MVRSIPCCPRIRDSRRVLRRWVRHHDIDAGEREGLTTAERQELSRLRREVRPSKQAREFLKRAGEAFGLSSSRRRRGFGERLLHAHRGGVNEPFYPTIGWWRPFVKAPINWQVRSTPEDTPKHRSGVRAETTQEHGDIPRQSASDRCALDLPTP
jgi:hypothetical protein